MTIPLLSMSYDESQSVWTVSVRSRYGYTLTASGVTIESAVGSMPEQCHMEVCRALSLLNDAISLECWRLPAAQELERQLGRE